MEHNHKVTGQPCQHIHKAKLSGNSDWATTCTDCGAPLDKNGNPLPEHKPKPSIQPPVGSWASVAWLMAQTSPDDGFDWDRWKDEMKDGEIT